jgi:hypothetical protein
VRALGDTTRVDVADGLGGAIGQPGGRLFSGVFRWSTDPAPDPGRGVWLPVDDPRVLPWLKPFGGEVLVGFEGTGRRRRGRSKEHDGGATNWPW